MSGTEDTEAAKTFLTRFLGEYDVPEVIYMDQLRSYGAAIREIPSLADVDHQQVISTALCNNLIEQEHQSTRRPERSGQAWPATSVLPKKSARIPTAETRSRVPESARQDHQPPPSFPHQCSCRHSTKQSTTSIPDVVSRRGRGGPRLRPPRPSACRVTN